MSVLVQQVACRDEFSRCYDDANVCFWTDGSTMLQSDARAACRQRNDSFLPRITNSDVQHKLILFRNADNATRNLLRTDGFWVDVRATNLSNFHWIDGSSLTGLLTP